MSPFFPSSPATREWSWKKTPIEIKIPLCIDLPQMIGYVKCFDSNKTMSFKVIDKKLLKSMLKYGKVIRLMNIEFESELVYGNNDKDIKTKIKSYGDKDKVNANFQSNKIPKENASYKYLSLIMLNSVIRVGKKYYPQTLFAEFKYQIKKNKMENLINPCGAEHFRLTEGTWTDYFYKKKSAVKWLI